MKTQYIKMGFLLFVLFAIQWIGGCTSTEIAPFEGDTNTGTDPDTGGDSDTDSDTDLDADTDTDTDSDLDTDTDTDTDTDSDSGSDPDTGEYLDQDSDGWIESIDCDDENPDANQGLPEIYDPPNGVDDDCDGLTDEEPGDRPVGHIPTTCEEADVGASSVGCVFYAVDFQIMANAQTFAVFVSNVQRSSKANVVLEQKVGNTWEPAPTGGPVALDPKTLHVFELPDNHINGSGFRVGGAYRITSDVPIVAYKVNPYGIQGGGAADATLLLQVPSWDWFYYVIGTPRVGGYAAYATIVASVDDTVVEVTPTTETAPGPPQIPFGRPGVPFNIILDAGDVAQVAIYISGTLMGTKITSDEDHPIAVFNGNACGTVGRGTCDTLYEQLSGVHKWGLEFVAPRMPVRSTDGTVDVSYWQIFASEDKTTVHFEAHPLVTGLPEKPITLNTGEHWEAFVSGVLGQPGDFYVRADKPIALFNYMTGFMEVNEDSPMQGDPSQVQISPIDQYLKRHIVLVPECHTYDFLTIVRPTGVPVWLDGNTMSESEFIAVGSSHEVARVLVPDGVHTVESIAALFVVVAGVNSGSQVSYAYMGGTGTRTINDIR